MGNKPPLFRDLAQRWLALASNAQPGSNQRDEPNSLACLDFDWLVEDDPEQAWETILQILHKTDSSGVLAQLAAGPLEDLLSYHGEQFIDRVETLARIDSRFAFLLGGVWQFNMTDAIWDRVTRVANRAGWDNVSPNE